MGEASRFLGSSATWKVKFDLMMDVLGLSPRLGLCVKVDWLIELDNFPR